MIYKIKLYLKAFWLKYHVNKNNKLYKISSVKDISSMLNFSEQLKDPNSPINMRIRRNLRRIL